MWQLWLGYLSKLNVVIEFLVWFREAVWITGTFRLEIQWYVPLILFFSVVG